MIIRHVLNGHILFRLLSHPSVFCTFNSAFLDGALQVSEELARVLEPGLHLPGHTPFLLGCGPMAVFPSRSCLVI